MSDPLSHYIVPIPNPDVADVLAAHQTAIEFYHEVRYRQAFEAHCDWYDTIAAQHRQDLAKMQREPNLMGWFNRWRGNR